MPESDFHKGSSGSSGIITIVKRSEQHASSPYVDIPTKTHTAEGARLVDPNPPALGVEGLQQSPVNESMLTLA